MNIMSRKVYRLFNLNIGASNKNNHLSELAVELSWVETLAFKENRLKF